MKTNSTIFNNTMEDELRKLFGSLPYYNNDKGLLNYNIAKSIALYPNIDEATLNVKEAMLTYEHTTDMKISKLDVDRRFHDFIIKNVDFKF